MVRACREVLAMMGRCKEVPEMVRGCKEVSAMMGRCKEVPEMMGVVQGSTGNDVGDARKC